MARIVTRTLLTLGVLYFAAVGAFALLHYEGERPGADQVFADFHAWLGFGEGKPAPAPPPPVAPPTPPPPPPTPPPEPAPPKEEDPHASALARAAEILAKAEEEAKALRAAERDGAFAEKRTAVLALVGEVREILIRVLDAAPEHRKANDLWMRQQTLQAAVRHL
jgi:hypothetical protein